MANLHSPITDDDFIARRAITLKFLLALAAVSAIWFTQQGLVAQVLGGAACALMIDVRYGYLFANRTWGDWFKAGLAILAMLLVWMKDQSIARVEFDLQLYEVLKSQAVVGAAVFAVVSLGLVLVLPPWLREFSDDGLFPSDPAQKPLAIDRVIERSMAWVVARPYVRYPLQWLFVALLLWWIVFLVSNAVSIQGSKASAGTITSVDTKTYCDPAHQVQSCRLVVDTANGEFRVDPGPFAVGDSVVVKRSAWSGISLCTGDECRVAVVQRASPEIASALKIKACKLGVSC